MVSDYIQGRGCCATLSNAACVTATEAQMCKEGIFVECMLNGNNVALLREGLCPSLWAQEDR